MLKRFAFFGLLFSTACLGDDAAYAPGDTFKDCDFCPEMVVIPPGTFEMGVRDGDPQADMRFELAKHTVTIDHSFAVSKFEVTRAEYRACVNDGGCESMPPRRTRLLPDHPVSWLSWNDAQAYVAWLSKRTGQAYSLLSEEEWEYAARGATNSLYWWGDEIMRGMEVCSDCMRTTIELISLKKPAVVGSLTPNPFGLYDMLGNVSEWTNGCFNDPSEEADMSSIGSDDECKYRIIKGTSFASVGIRRLRPSARMRNFPDSSQISYGLRVKRQLPDKP